MSELLPPRDPKMLLKEMSARIKIKDIQALHRLQDQVTVKWYESGFVPILFVAALSFLVIVLQLAPKPNVIVTWFVIGSSITLILIVTAILEFLLRKFHAMRRLYELQSHLVEHHEKRFEELQRKLDELRSLISSEENGEGEQTAPGPDAPEG